ncbi:hypothetical protein CRENBAI_020504 [Crenichthys baileyi]|uniref:Secreted protein n=1 Tax=Crenichthys baileyi TaxID=28760 RepID=A0AAV9S661_9TELE
MYDRSACLQKLVCLFTISPGVPSVDGSSSFARTRNVLREAEKEKEMHEQRGSRRAEEIVLAWWPEAFQLSGHHYLSLLPLRSCMLVLRCGQVC